VLWKVLQKCCCLKNFRRSAEGGGHDSQRLGNLNTASRLFERPIISPRQHQIKADDIFVISYFLDILFDTNFLDPPTLCFFTHKLPAGPSIQVKPTRIINPSMQCMWKH
jgi:hypothetical protein